MGPKINGNSVADLVLAAVHKQLEVEMGDYKDLLNSALARINCLEKEIAQCRQHSNPTFPINKSSSKSDICRHWLKNQCKWKQKCRFSHGGGASSTSSMSDSNAKDMEEVATYAMEKVDKSVQVALSLDFSSSSASTCDIPLQSSELVGCLLNLNLPSRPCSVSGVLQPELVGAALSNSVVDSLMDNLLESVVSSSNAKPAPVPTATSRPWWRRAFAKKEAPSVRYFTAPVAEEEEWLDRMLDVIGGLEAKYGAKYKPVGEGGVIYSAEVAIPKVDFAQVKPHLHRKLPKPALFPVQSCSNDPDFYMKCTGPKSSHFCNKEHDGELHEDLNEKLAPIGPTQHAGSCLWENNQHQSTSLFSRSDPFGHLPGFDTSLGVVSVPDEPIGGYIYAGGAGDSTVWQLHAQAVYI